MKLHSVRNVLILLVVSTILILSSLLLVALVQNGGNEEEEHREEESVKKTSACLLCMLILAIGILVAVVVTTRRAVFSNNMLGGMSLMFANLSLLVLFYMFNLSSREQGDANEEDQEGASKRGAFLTAVCWLSIVLYSAVAITLLWNESKNKATNIALARDDRIQSETLALVLSEIWSVLSIFVSIAFLCVLVVSLIPLFLEDAERVREEGLIWNFVLVVSWMWITAVALGVFGRRVFGGFNVQTNNAGLGTLLGLLIGMVVIELLVTLLFASFRVEERRRERETTMGSTMFACLCLVLAVVHGIFAIGIIRHLPRHWSNTADTNASEETTSSWFVNMGPDGAESSSNKRWFGTTKSDNQKEERKQDNAADPNASGILGGNALF